MMPLARSALVLEDLGEEVIAYDPETAVAHVLSPLAAGVLLLCDGERDHRVIASSLAASGRLVEPATVQDAVATLEQAGLLVPGAG